MKNIKVLTFIFGTLFVMADFCTGAEPVKIPSLEEFNRRLMIRDNSKQKKRMAGLYQKYNDPASSSIFKKLMAKEIVRREQKMRMAKRFHFASPHP